MPALGRKNAKPLLRTVGNKPHASDDDHEGNGLPNGTRAGLQMPTPASSNSTRGSGNTKKPEQMDDSDIYADPISSDDEMAQGFRLPAQASTSTVKSEESVDFKHPPQLDGFNEPQKSVAKEFKRPTRSGDAKDVRTSPEFRKPAITSPPLSVGSKRSADASDHAGSDSDGFMFSSQTSQVKRPRVASVTPNLHAQPRPTKAKGYGSGLYGSEALRKRSREEEQKKKAELKRGKAAEAEKAKGPVFRRPNLPADMLAFQGQDVRPGFKQSGKSGDVSLDCEAGADDFREDSPDLSDLSSVPSSPPQAEVAALDLRPVEPRAREMECAICGTNVPMSLREDYEGQYSQAKQWSYKWQQRFCDYHKQRAAMHVWEERGYPDIDWIGLDARLRQRKHITHLKRIIGGETQSVFRKQFETRVKSRAKTLLQAANDDNAGKTASAGYYGPRGEKLMTDHIISSFASDLRSHATKDRLVAASGVSGGVSGFVQGVLVPELAVSLIREDLVKAKSKADPVQVLAESAELGELLCPELEDEVKAVEETGYDSMEE